MNEQRGYQTGAGAKEEADIWPLYHTPLRWFDVTLHLPTDPGRRPRETMAEKVKGKRTAT